MMRVVEISEPGGPDVLRIAERGTPQLQADEVLVRVRVSGVNRADLLQRRGRYPAPEGDGQDVPGLEYSGVVEQVGERCRMRRVGDRVMGILGGGAYAETIAISERATIRVPNGMSLTEAGAIPEAFVTAWDALYDQAKLRAGEVVLVHAVGSGVGTAALQLGRVTGASVIGTSRTPDELRRAGELGLEVGLDTQGQQGWAEQVTRISPSGVDVILDLVGGSYFEDNLQSIGMGGRWIVVGVPGGGTGTLDLGRLMSRRAILRGTLLRSRPIEQKIRLAREFERTIVPLFERGLLRPVVDRVYPAERSAEAHAFMEANESFGKILLSWAPPQEAD